MKSEDKPAASRALDELCRQYHYPLYCFIRRRGLSHHDAQDALHDFLAKMLRLEAFARVETGKGSLRGYLTTSLKRFLIDWQRSPRQSTGGQGRWAEQSLDFDRRYETESFSDEETPERVLDRKWGAELIGRVVEELRGTYAARGKHDLFEALHPVLMAGGSLRGADPQGLAAALGIKEGTLRVSMSRLLDDFREALREEVLQTVSSSEELDDELLNLMKVFSQP
jgi:RNA polymerase sigma-70 factor (ECF subfamily)